MTEDRSVTRDSKGRFITASLSSEEAGRIGKLSGESRKGTSRDALLEEAGYEPDNAPEHLRLLARLAAGTGSGAVSAMNAFIKLTAKSERQVEAGNTCQYAEACVLFAAYEGRAGPQETETARERWASSTRSRGRSALPVAGSG